jgi:O-antigen/teichoic acid export membrane protein
MIRKRPPDEQAPDPPLSPLELEGRILRNTGWVALGLGATQVASLLAMFVLARILDPEDFGLVALAWSVLYFVQQIQETGVGSALVYRRKDVQKAAASALVYTPLASALFYWVVFLVAPIAARFLHAPDLVDVLRVMALVLVFRGLGVVPGAILERNLDFRSRTIAELVAAFVQVGVFLGLAFAGLGVWSLVFGNLVAAALQTTLYWLFVPWLPSPRKASRQILRELMRYGRFVGAHNVLVVVNNTVDNVVVSRVLGTTSVGLYSVAYRLADLPNSVIGQVVGRTMFSVYSMLEHDLPAVRHAYVRNLQRIALLALPVSVGLVIAAEPIVRALLGDKWLPAVPALRILAVYALIKPFGGVSAEALKGIGAPQWNLVFGITYVAVVIPALVILTRELYLKGAAISMLIAIVAAVVPAVAVTARKVGLSGTDLARALARSAFCSVLLAVTLLVLLPRSESMAPVAALALLVSVGLVVYVLATALFARSIVVPMWVSLRHNQEQ